MEWAKKEHHLLGYFPDSEWEGPTLSQPMKKLQAEVAKVRKRPRCPVLGEIILCLASSSEIALKFFLFLFLVLER